jgi:hypothetical protein
LPSSLRSVAYDLTMRALELGLAPSNVEKRF